MVKIKRKDTIGAVPIMSSKLIVENGLEDLWRRENPDSPEFTCYDRSFAKDPGHTKSILISILI